MKRFGSTNMALRRLICIGGRDPPEAERFRLARGPGVVEARTPGASPLPPEGVSATTPLRSAAGAAAATRRAASRTSPRETSRWVTKRTMSGLEPSGFESTPAARNRVASSTALRPGERRRRPGSSRPGGGAPRPGRPAAAVASARALSWSSARRATLCSSAWRPAAARTPAWRMAAARAACGAGGPSRIRSRSPASTEPTGAPSPFERQSETSVAPSAKSRAGTPEATTAFMSRAPSR